MAFKLAINMPGAVSAGAYTAGVLDFLIEALDAWYEAKRNHEAVPGHEISIEAFTGASAGGMCAAISAVLLQDRFDHITDTSVVGSTNRLYESWVNQIDIVPLLSTKNLNHASKGVTSLLDCSVIDQIATDALTRGTPMSVPRAYVSPSLTLFLSLTNLRGVPYALHGVAPDSVEQSTFFYGDRMRFQTTTAGQGLRSPAAYPIDLSSTSTTGAAWDQLRSAAKATGAFPAFLEPRTLTRRKIDYTPPLWESWQAAAQDTPPPTQPTFPPGMPDTFQTLNVDGGITNNDPFNYAADYLRSVEPSLSADRLPQEADVVDRAVLTIAPFPTTDIYSPSLTGGTNASILWTIPQLVSALISQSRFFGESLSAVMSGTTFSSFVIAPSDDELTQTYQARAQHALTPPALQCACLGAFGGFFERGFRAHDFALGRRNCQKFLLEHFILPIENPLIAAGLPAEAEARAAILRDYGRPAPPGQVAGQWLPVIPLCTENVRRDRGPVPRVRISQRKLGTIVDLILTRFRAVVAAMLNLIPDAGLRLFLGVGQPVITSLAKGPLTRILIKTLQQADSVEPG